MEKPSHPRSHNFQKMKNIFFNNYVLSLPWGVPRPPASKDLSPINLMNSRFLYF